MSTNSDHTITLNQSELTYLMKIWDVDSVVGISSSTLKMTQSANAVQTSLKKKKISDGGTDRSSIKDQYHSWFDALFVPQRAAIIIRDLPKIGKQLLVFSSNNGVAILHTMPSRDEHRLVSMTLQEVDTFLMTWFSVSSYENIDPISFVVNTDDLESARMLAENGQAEKASGLLEKGGVDHGIASDWIQSVQRRRFSGSFASLLIENNEAQDIDSFALLAGESSVWLILQEDAEGKRMRVFRSNGRSKDRIYGLIQFLFENRNKRFSSFVLRLENLAFCLAAINRADLGYKLLATGNGNGADQKLLMERMQKGGLSLVEMGLCSVSKNGVYILAPTLEKAVFPLVQFDYMLQARIDRPDLSAESIMYVQHKRLFTSQFISQGSYVLECGSSEFLDVYIENLFGDFALKKMKLKSNFPISLGLLQKALESKKLDRYEDQLHKNSASRDFVKMIVDDVNDQSYQARLIRLDAGSETTKKSASGLVKPMLVFLEAKKRSWVFSFPSNEDESVGSAQIVDRAGFIKLLKKFTG